MVKNNVAGRENVMIGRHQSSTVDIRRLKRDAVLSGQQRKIVRALSTMAMTIGGGGPNKIGTNCNKNPQAEPKR